MMNDTTPAQTPTEASTTKKAAAKRVRKPAAKKATPRTSPRKARSAKKAARPKGDKDAKKAKLADQLAVELRGLHTTFKDSVEHYRLRVESDLLAAMKALENGQSASTGRRKLPKAGEMEALLKRVKAAKIKPKKGRPKDLTRMRQLARRAKAIVPE